MKSIISLILMAGLFSTNALAFDIKVLANNKETTSRIVSRLDHISAQNWAANQGNREILKSRSKEVLRRSVSEIIKRPMVCDLGFSDLFISQAIGEGLIDGAYEVKNLVYFMRIENIIDDLFAENIITSYNLSRKINRNDNLIITHLPPIHVAIREFKDLNLEKIYQEFAVYPDETNTCSLGAFFRVISNVKAKNKIELNLKIKKLNYLAYQKSIISNESYKRLETLRKNNVWNWPVYLNKYFEIAKNAKDLLSISGPVDDPAPFSTAYANRKAKLTQRERLYKNYNSTQIIILTEIIQKTAKRMEAGYAAINIHYNTPDEEIETYVLSPMEKYRMALKMLRKDMGEVMRGDNFSGISIEYEDLIAAAYETGYLKAEELELVLKFEEFWNPKSPKWKVYANFAFSLAGSASFFLPPPWNIVGAIGLVVTQSQIIRSNKKANVDDNWNSII
jgi:hypothetical protein